MGVDTQQLHGFDDLIRKLEEIPVALRKRVLRNALAAGGRVVRDEARRVVPVLASHTRNPYRKPGTVKKALSVRTSKTSRRNGDVGVFVNVRPLKQSQIRAFKVSAAGLGKGFSGSRNPNDPYYWQWLNFGRAARSGAAARSRVQRIKGLVKGVRARSGRRAVGASRPYRFLEAGARRLPEALNVFQRQVGAWFAKTNASGKVQP